MEPTINPNTASNVYRLMQSDGDTLKIDKSSGFLESRMVTVYENGQEVAHCLISDLMEEINNKKNTINDEGEARTLSKAVKKLKEAEEKQLEFTPSLHNRFFGGKTNELKKISNNLVDKADEIWWNNNFKKITITDAVKKINFLNPDDFNKFIEVGFKKGYIYEMKEDARILILTNLSEDKKEVFKSYLNDLFPGSYKQIVKILGCLNQNQIKDFISDAAIKKFILNPNNMLESWFHLDLDSKMHRQSNQYWGEKNLDEVHRVGCAFIVKAASTIKTNNPENLQTQVNKWVNYKRESFLNKVRSALVNENSIVSSSNFDRWIFDIK